MIKDLDIGGLGARAWDSFVSSHPLGTVFHCRDWHRVIEDTYGFGTRYLTRLGSGGHIVSAIPYVYVRGLFGGGRVISYPFSDHCDPLVESAEDFDGLAGDIRRRLRASSIEIKAYGFCRKAAPKHVRHHNFVIEGLEKGAEAVYKRFHRDCIRRAITRAEKSGVEVLADSTMHGMRAYYTLHQLTRKKLGVPPQPFAFFRNIIEKLSPSGMAEVLLARLNGRWVAGLVMLRFGKTAYYKFGASDPAYLRFGANQLLMWSAISKAAEQGLSYFDLGRCAGSETGLMEYKARWGAVKRPLPYFSIPEKEINESNYRILTGVIKRLPMFSNRVIGELLYKYLA